MHLRQAEQAATELFWRRCKRDVNDSQWPLGVMRKGKCRNEWLAKSDKFTSGLICLKEVLHLVHREASF